MIGLMLGTALAGTLGGTVVDEDGDPVEGAYVVAYDQRFNYDYDITGEFGGWDLELPANPYRLRVLTPSTRNLAERWAGAEHEVCDGALYEVTEDSSDRRIELVVYPGAELSGTLVDPDGAPLEDVLIMARPVSGSSVQSRYAYSESDGSFLLPGLPAAAADGGAFEVEFERDDLPDQYLGESYDSDEGELVEVALGEVTDLGEAMLLRGITVGGAVDTPDGPVIDGNSIQVYGGSQVKSTLTEDGRYEVFGLPPGEVLSWGYVSGYALTYYPDADRAGEREEVLEEDEVFDTLDLFFPTESTLSGRFDVPGDASGITLLFYNDTSTVGLGEAVEEDGTFVIDRLHPGDYKLFVYADDEGYLDDYVRDSTGEPVWYTVLEGDNTLEEPISLTPGNQVSGTVTDKYTGAPIYGAYVIARSETGETEADTTDASGNYELIGLIDDRWSLEVSYTPYCSSDAGWVTVYYQQTVNEALAGTVALSDGSAITWDPVMPPDDDQDGMDDVWEEEAGLDPDYPDGGEDPDGDGYTNLEEYLLGSDPLASDGDADPECGCASGGAGGVLPIWVVAALWRRRRP